MLVLRRKAGEAIVLNGVITIHIFAIEGDRIKLGIEAPPDVEIVRKELLDEWGTPRVYNNDNDGDDPPPPFRNR